MTQDYKKEAFLKSLAPKDRDLVKKVDELYSDWVDEQIANERLNEWEKQGKPKSYSLENAKKEALRA